MPTDQFIALVILAFPACFSPGLNNALVANSSATFGIRRTVPHIAGIVTGFPAMLFIVGVLLAGLFRQSTYLRLGIQLLGCALLLWLAWKIARSGSLTSRTGKPRPFTYMEAALFQWVNPKAWTLAVAVTAQFVSDADPVISALIVALVFGAAVMGSNLSWGLAGQTLTRWNSDPRILRAVNLTLAGLMVMTVLLLLLRL